VHGVSTRKRMRWFNGMKQILQAHGAVCMKLPWLAFVIQKGNTRGACVTVHVTIVAFVYSTDAALVAMIIPSLRPIIKEVARCAEIRRELDAACSVAARLRHRLTRVTRVAHHFFDGMSINFMRLGIVVAVAAHVHFVTTGGNQAASSNVVLAMCWHFRVLLMLNMSSNSGGGGSRSRSRSRGPCPALHLLHFGINCSNPFAARLLRFCPQFNAAFPGRLVRISEQMVTVSPSTLA
jgi:hypothetical protein